MSLLSQPIPRLRSRCIHPPIHRPSSDSTQPYCHHLPFAEVEHLQVGRQAKLPQLQQVEQGGRLSVGTAKRNAHRGRDCQRTSRRGWLICLTSPSPPPSPSRLLLIPPLPSPLPHTHTHTLSPVPLLQLSIPFFLSLWKCLSDNPNLFVGRVLVLVLQRTNLWKCVVQTICYLMLVYTTQVNSAFCAIWLVPQSRDIEYYSPPGGFRVKKMSRETHFIRK